MPLYKLSHKTIIGHHFAAHLIIIALVIYVCAAELFHVEIFKGENVRIVGYLPPPTKFGQTKWYLMVYEDTHGILERFPKFRPTNEHVRLAVATFNLYKFHAIFIFTLAQR